MQYFLQVRSLIQRHVPQFHGAIFVGNHLHEVDFKPKSQEENHYQNKEKNPNIYKEKGIQITYINVQLFSSIFV